MTYLAEKIPGASFTTYIAEMIPSFTALQLFMLLGSTSTASKRNYAGTKTDATLVGVPTYSTGYATVTNGTKGFEAPMAAANGHFTHIVVATHNAAVGGGAYMGRWMGGGNQDLLAQDGTNLRVATDGGFKVSHATTAFAGFSFLAGTYDGATATAYSGSAGALSKTSAAFVGGTLFSSKVRVGASWGGGSPNIAAAMHAPTAIAEADLLLIYGYLTRLLATRGITVN